MNKKMTFELRKDAKLANNIFNQPDAVYARDGYGKGLVELGEKNEKVVVLTGDLSESTRCHWFAEKFPKRFIQVGVAEQNMMGLAAGLALSGKTPFVSSYATFSPGRAWDQLRVSAGYSNTNVKVAGAHAGISVGPDGATHQALEDIASVRCIPNFVVEVPCDWLECKKTTLAFAEHKGPCYFRFGREKTPVLTTSETPFEIGKAQIFKDGTDVAIIACGAMVYESLIAAKRLDEKGISACVVNNHTIKPLDVKTITKVAKECGAVVTAEEHQVQGGMGSAIAECLAENYPVPMKFVGMQDTFGESGEPRELLDKYKMNSSEIERKALEVVKRK